jgi:hypothetical protein
VVLLGLGRGSVSRLGCGSALGVGLGLGRGDSVAASSTTSAASAFASATVSATTSVSAEACSGVVALPAWRSSCSHSASGSTADTLPSASGFW